VADQVVGDLGDPPAEQHRLAEPLECAGAGMRLRDVRDQLVQPDRVAGHASTLG
jgi:hypothetical protein